MIKWTKPTLNDTTLQAQTNERLNYEEEGAAHTDINSCGESEETMAEGIRCLVTQRFRNLRKLSPQTSQMLYRNKGDGSDIQQRCLTPWQQTNVILRLTADSGNTCVKNSTSFGQQACKNLKRCYFYFSPTNIVFYFSVQTC